MRFGNGENKKFKNMEGRFRSTERERESFSYGVGWDQKGLIFSGRHILDGFHRGSTTAAALVLLEMVGSDEYVEVGSKRRGTGTENIGPASAGGHYCYYYYYPSGGDQ